MKQEDRMVLVAIKLPLLVTGKVLSDNKCILIPKAISNLQDH